MRLCINRVMRLLLVLTPFCLHAQVPQEAKSVKNFEHVFFRSTSHGKVPEAVCTGQEANPLGGGLIEIKGFELQTLRDGQTTQFIARAPQCVVDIKEEYASSPGPLQGFNANTNFYIEGVGFLCTKSNSSLVISNKVETRI